MLSSNRENSTASSFFFCITNKGRYYGPLRSGRFEFGPLFDYSLDISNGIEAFCNDFAVPALDSQRR